MMPTKYGKDSNFKGKKGKSGRKCFRDEQLRIEVIEDAWKKKKKRMNDNEATQIVLKDMGEKIKGDKDNPLQVVHKIIGMKISKE